MKIPACKSLARFFAVITALLVAHVQVSEGSKQRCYVCVPRAGGSAVDLQAMFPGEKAPLPKCEDFNADDSRFKKDCPSSFEGCITQTNGSQVTRSCGDLSVNDCKIANHIKYCYCSDNLCNHEPASSYGGDHPDATDDEDLTASEGSGGGGGGHRETHQHRQRGGGDVTQPTATVRLVTPMTTTAASSQSAKSDASRTNTIQMAVVVGVLCLVLRGRW